MGNKKTSKTKKKATENMSSQVPIGNNSKRTDEIRLELLKEFGTNAIVIGSDLEKARYGRISTGSVSLDLALGGGIPVGRAIQISGAKSTCKTSICNHIAKNAQKLKVDWIWTERKYDKGREAVQEHPRSVDGLICGYIDVEGTQDEDWMRQIGVDTNSWLYNQPSGLEEALNIAHSMQRKGVQVIFLDSIDSLEPELYYKTEAGESVRMGEKQKQIGEYLRKYTATNNRLVREGKLPCTLVLLNQLREKIGAYGDWNVA